MCSQWRNIRGKGEMGAHPGVPRGKEGGWGEMFIGELSNIERIKCSCHLVVRYPS